MRKKFLIIFSCFFFIAMLAFTFISKHLATDGLLKVETMWGANEVEVPVECVYDEPGMGTYVQVIELEETILGEQFVVNDLAVKVMKRRNGIITVDLGNSYYEIIIKTDRPLSRGESVRKE